MKKNIIFLASIIISSLTYCYIEIKSCTELYNYKIDQDTLLIWDIDETLIIPVSYRGSNEWFRHQLRLYEKNGYSPDDAQDMVSKEYLEIQKTITVQPVEPEIVSFIKKCQEQNISTIGLTARLLPLVDRTAELLNSIDIDFNHTAPVSSVTDFNLKKPCIYKNGILFCGTNDKGDALQKLFEITGKKYTKILFIDNQEKNAKAVEDAGKKLGVETFSFWYRYLDYNIYNYIDL